MFPYKLETPVEVVWENTPMATEKEEIMEFTPKSDFNFLCVSQMGPRKNLENTIKWFVEEFIDQDVGLILKTNTRGNNRMDLEHTEGVLKLILASYPDRKCNVSLLHGDLSEGQMRALYEHDKIKAMVNISHGEGFGLPLFEAARSCLPIITIGWSGQVDFLDDKFLKVKHELGPVQKQAVWDGVIQAESQWAYADQGSYKMALRQMFKRSDEFVEQAEELQDHVDTRFRDEILFEGFCNSILGKCNLEPEEVKSISFCISTNGAKPEKTKLEVQSIVNTMSQVDIPFSVIIAGDVTNFSDLKECILVDASDDAHNGRLAKLRNIAAEKVEVDTIVFVDDDFIFPETWAQRFLAYSKESGWQVTANKILLPDGSRFWDRATISPHKLVSYNHPTYDKKLYQTGGFWIMRADLYKDNLWDSSIEINAERTGGVNEDVEMSLRMHNQNITLCFDDKNVVWHNDDSYIEFKNLTLKKDIAKQYGLAFEPPINRKFKKLLETLND